MCNVGQPCKYLTLNQMERMVYMQRNKDFGDWEAIIMSLPLIIANPTCGSLFLFFNAGVQIEDSNGIPAI